MEGYMQRKENLKRYIREKAGPDIIVSTELMEALFDEIDTLAYQVRDTCFRAEGAEAERDRYRAALSHIRADSGSLDEAIEIARNALEERKEG